MWQTSYLIGRDGRVEHITCEYIKTTNDDCPHDAQYLFALKSLEISSDDLACAFKQHALKGAMSKLDNTANELQFTHQSELEALNDYIQRATLLSHHPQLARDLYPEYRLPVEYAKPGPLPYHDLTAVGANDAFY